MTNPGKNNFHLNDNPEEKIRIENEFLQLKLKVELGAETFISGNFPPEVENTFLKNVLAFENSFSKYLASKFLLFTFIKKSILNLKME